MWVCIECVAGITWQEGADIGGRGEEGGEGGGEKRVEGGRCGEREQVVRGEWG